MAQFFEKDPDAILPYTIDWSLWLETGDSISLSTWVVDPVGSLAVNTDSKGTDFTTVTLEGGIIDTEYDVRNTITTANGLVDVRTIKVTVKLK